MSARRFLGTFAFSALAAATLVVGVNALIDPLGVVPASPSVPGLNAEKVMRFNNDRIYKPLDLLTVRPRTVVLGTSRVLQAFDPETLSHAPYGPAYNYGLAGGDLDELEAHFEKFIAATPSVKYVFVELFLPRLVAPARQQVPSMPELLAAALFSWSAVHQSVETVWHNHRHRAGMPAAGPVVLPDGRQSFVKLSTLSNFLAYPSATVRAPKRYELTPAIVASLRRMREVARQRRITLTFFISPMHAVQLYGVYVTGHWSVLEQLKRELAREFEVLDFSAYTSITEEPARAEMHYWKDPHHFSPLIGRMLAERLVRLPSVAGDFGVQLAADHLEGRLRTEREARDRWIARNPGWAELFRLARAGMDTSLAPIAGAPGGEPCPVRIGDRILSRLGPLPPRPLWIVLSSRTTQDAAIVVRVREGEAGSHEASQTCQLTIEAAPETPTARPVEWRMGYPLGSSTALHGRRLRYTVRMRATAPMDLSAGSIYVDDGIRITSAPLPAISRGWRTVAVEHVVARDASRLGIWLRLVEGHGTIRPVGGTLSVEAAVDLVDGPPGGSPPAS